MELCARYIRTWNDASQIIVTLNVCAIVYALSLWAVEPATVSSGDKNERQRKKQKRDIVCVHVSNPVEIIKTDKKNNIKHWQQQRERVAFSMLSLWFTPAADTVDDDDDDYNENEDVLARTSV